MNKAPFCAAALLSACTIVASPPDRDETRDPPADNCDCAIACEADGFQCADSVSCACGSYTDPLCAVGADKMCACIAEISGESCTDSERLLAYTTCFRWELHPDADNVLCFGVYSDSTCQDAVNGCLQ